MIGKSVRKKGSFENAPIIENSQGQSLVRSVYIYSIRSTGLASKVGHAFLFYYHYHYSSVSFNENLSCIVLFALLLV